MEGCPSEEGGVQTAVREVSRHYFSALRLMYMKFLPQR